jgi:hypothetical protein
MQTMSDDDSKPPGKRTAELHSKMTRLIIEATIAITESRLALGAMSLRTVLLWHEYALRENDPQLYERYLQLLPELHSDSEAWCERLFSPIKITGKGGSA